MKKSEIASLVAQNALFHQLNRRAERELGTSLVQYRLLQVVLARPGITLQELAREVGAHPSTLTPAIRRLAGRDALFVDEHPRDSRKKIVGLTAKGAAMIRRFDAGIEAIEISAALGG